MTLEPQPMSLSILDREYVVGCAPAERASLLEAAADVDNRLRQARASARNASLDRLAVLVALNLAHELNQRGRERSSESDGLGRELLLLRERLTHVLGALDPPAS